jgi:hypothetical protein
MHCYLDREPRQFENAIKLRNLDHQVFKEKLVTESSHQITIGLLMFIPCPALHVFSSPRIWCYVISCFPLQCAAWAADSGLRLENLTVLGWKRQLEPICSLQANRRKYYSLN